MFCNAAVDEGDGQSSIHGLFLNHAALAALLHIEVLDHQVRQHRAGKATVAWNRLLQSGFVARGQNECLGPCLSCESICRKAMATIFDAAPLGCCGIVVEACA